MFHLFRRQLLTMIVISAVSAPFSALAAKRGRFVSMKPIQFM